MPKHSPSPPPLLSLLEATTALFATVAQQRKGEEEGEEDLIETFAHVN